MRGLGVASGAFRPRAATRFDLEMRKRVYAGAVLVFKSPAMRKLASHFRKFYVSEHDDVHALTAAHVQDICEQFERDESVASLYREAFTQAGIPVSAQWDRVRLRIQRSGEGLDDIKSEKFASGRYSGTLPLHRDSWASNRYDQINWWAPLAPVDEGRTLLLYPSYFEREVPNTSRDWDFNELRSSRKRGGRYPQLPVYSGHDNEQLTLMIEEDGRPIVIEPGEMLCFSSAHLHASAVNSSGLARFSTEVRTVQPDDHDAGLGAPNVDGLAPRKPKGWFKDVYP